MINYSLPTPVSRFTTFTLPRIDCNPSSLTQSALFSQSARYLIDEINSSNEFSVAVFCWLWTILLFGYVPVIHCLSYGIYNVQLFFWFCQNPVIPRLIIKLVKLASGERIIATTTTTIAVAAHSLFYSVFFWRQQFELFSMEVRSRHTKNNNKQSLWKIYRHIHLIVAFD